VSSKMSILRDLAKNTYASDKFFFKNTGCLDGRADQFRQ